MRLGEGLLWAVKSCPRVTEMGAEGMAIYRYRVLPPKCRREVRGGATASCQKMAEIWGESGAVKSCGELQENDRNEGKGDSVASYRELPGSGRNESRRRGCR
jgi:hypothetical protein